MTSHLQRCKCEYDIIFKQQYRRVSSSSSCTELNCVGLNVTERGLVRVLLVFVGHAAVTVDVLTWHVSVSLVQLSILSSRCAFYVTEKRHSALNNVSIRLGI